MMKVLMQLMFLVASASAFMVNPNGMAARSATSLFMSDARQTGTVKWFDTQKGFGFIVPDDGSNDVFVHQTEIVAEGFRSLADGEPVEFENVTDGNGRTKATKVTGPGGAEVQGAPFQPQRDFDDDY